jgi:hypothetical protein
MSSELTPARAGASVRAPDASLTIDEFCRAEKISRSMLYRAWSEGWGPRYQKHLDSISYGSGMSYGVATGARRCRLACS